MDMDSLPTSSSRILYDVPCAVCTDHSSGKHYGVFACDGCAGFFKRSVRRDRRYVCKARSPGACLVDKTHRNQCRACRLAKCLDVGMNKDAVQHERGPRGSTIRRQMALLLKDPTIPNEDITMTPLPVEVPIPKYSMMAPPPITLIHPYTYRLNIGPLNPSPLDYGSPPPVTQSLLSPSTSEAMCEAAARLLFMNVRWAKNVPAFTTLSLPDRLLLLEESWRGLFMIGAAQLMYPFDLRVLASLKNPSINLKDVELFEKALEELARVRADSNEFACLRSIVLFETNEEKPEGARESRKLQDLLMVATLQSHSKAMLTDYLSRTQPHDTSRAGKLLMLLPLLRKVPSEIIVELFFRTTIGNIPIEKIISDMYRTGKDTV